MNPNKLIVIAGPTGVGKTSLAFKLNQRLDSVIISADSRQVYKEMHIGTVKPTQTEIEENNIKLVDHIHIWESYNAGSFKDEAEKHIKEQHQQDKIPILAGGTGLYITAVTEGLHDFPEIDEETRQSVQRMLNENGLDALATLLLEKDPDYYHAIDIKNPRRVSRALEVILQSGQRYSSIISKPLENAQYQVIPIVLMRDRKELYQRIEHNVDAMFEKGLLEEVQSLVEYKNLKALDTVAYKECFAYLEGQCDLPTCISEIKKNSRRYAKRQITWLQRYPQSCWYHPDETENIMNYLQSQGLKNI